MPLFVLFWICPDKRWQIQLSLLWYIYKIQISKSKIRNKLKIQNSNAQKKKLYNWGNLFQFLSFDIFRISKLYNLSCLRTFVFSPALLNLSFLFNWGDNNVLFFMLFALKLSPCALHLAPPTRWLNRQIKM